MAKNKKNTYSYNQLVGIFNSIDNTLSSDKDEEKKSFNRKLVFKLRKNMKKIKEAMELVEEDLKDFPDGFQEFKQQNIEIMQEFGAELVPNQRGGFEVTNFNDFATNEKYLEKIKEHNEEHEDLLKEVEKVQNENAEIKADKSATVEWSLIPLDLFPEEITEDQFPLSFMEFVVEDEEG